MTERNRLGMILFVLSESVFFTLLIVAYVFYHHPGAEGPSAAGVLDRGKAAGYSVALLCSSLTLWLAGLSLRRREQARAASWLLGTFVLGGVFLVGQALEYAHLLRAHVTVSRNLFGASFFTLTGFHGFHVFVGLVMLAILAGLTLARSRPERVEAATEAVAVYWHFVDGVWVVIFSIVYLWSMA